MQSKGPLIAEDISHYLEMPVRLVRDLLFELVDAGIVSETHSKKGRRVIGYQPGIDINKLTVKFVVDALEGRGVSDIPIPKTEEMECLQKCLKTMDDQAAQSKGNVLLKSISLDQ
jgi:membrane protein